MSVAQGDKRARWGPGGATPVWVLPVAASGCGACLRGILALQAPRYAGALRSSRIRFARSPRQANVLLLAGALNRVARERVERVLAAVPRPYAVVAVGNCAIDGCAFAGSPELEGSLADAFETHVEIPGCPPTPVAILAGILDAQRLLASAFAVDDPASAAAEPTSTPAVDQAGQIGSESERFVGSETGQKAGVRVGERERESEGRATR